MSFDGKQIQLAIIGRFSVIKLKIFLKSSFMLGKSHAEKKYGEEFVPQLCFINLPFFVLSLLHPSQKQKEKVRSTPKSV